MRLFLPPKKASVVYPSVPGTTTNLMEGVEFSPLHVSIAKSDGFLAQRDLIWRRGHRFANALDLERKGIKLF
jgi:hypothetical protein